MLGEMSVLKHYGASLYHYKAVKFWTHQHGRHIYYFSFSDSVDL